MPDPWAWSVALVASFATGATATWLLRRTAAQRGPAAHGCALLAAFAAAALVGWTLLDIAPRLPPRNALDRFLAIILPAALAFEALAASNRIAPRWAWRIRAVGAPLLGAVLLYDSIYLRPNADGAAMTAGLTGVFGGGCLVWFVGRMLTREPSDESARATNSAAVLFALALAMLTAGFATMLAGYLKGGAAALPLAGAMAAAACSSALARRAPEELSRDTDVVRLSVVGMYGLTMIGLFFGGLTTLDASLLFLAPLGAVAARWLTPGLTRDWRGALFGLLVVTIPLAITIVRSLDTFQRKFQPLVK